MDDENKQKRTLKETPKNARRRRRLIVSLAVLATIIILGFIIYGLFSTLNPSKKLISKINSMHDGKHTCQQGLPVIKPYAQDLINTKKYSNQAREEGLDYLTNCSFILGNKVQAISYAGQLLKLYEADGASSASKQQQLAQFIQYIQSYSPQRK